MIKTNVIIRDKSKRKFCISDEYTQARPNQQYHSDVERDYEEQAIASMSHLPTVSKSYSLTHPEKTEKHSLHAGTELVSSQFMRHRSLPTHAHQILSSRTGFLQALKAGDITPCLESYSLFVQCAETTFANGL
jgi:hypothetical protein